MATSAKPQPSSADENKHLQEHPTSTAGQMVPYIWAYFSTDGCIQAPRLVPDPPPPQVVRSNPAADMDQMIQHYRARFPHVAYGIFANSSEGHTQWHIHWFFDAYDAHVQGAEFLYNLLLKMQKQNEEFVCRFAKDWSDQHNSSYPWWPNLIMGIEFMFNDADRHKFGDEFCRHALQHIARAYRIACDQQNTYHQNTYEQAKVEAQVIAHGQEQPNGTITMQTGQPPLQFHPVEFVPQGHREPVLRQRGMGRRNAPTPFNPELSFRHQQHLTVPHNQPGGLSGNEFQPHYMPYQTNQEVFWPGSNQFSPQVNPPMPSHGHGHNHVVPLSPSVLEKHGPAFGGYGSQMTMVAQPVQQYVAHPTNEAYHPQHRKPSAEQRSSDYGQQAQERLKPDDIPSPRRGGQYGRGRRGRGRNSFSSGSARRATINFAPNNIEYHGDQQRRASYQYLQPDGEEKAHWSDPHKSTFPNQSSESKQALPSTTEEAYKAETQTTENKTAQSSAESAKSGQISSTPKTIEHKKDLKDVDAKEALPNAGHNFKQPTNVTQHGGSTFQEKKRTKEADFSRLQISNNYIGEDINYIDELFVPTFPREWGIVEAKKVFEGIAAVRELRRPGQTALHVFISFESSLETKRALKANPIIICGKMTYLQVPRRYLRAGNEGSNYVPPSRGNWHGPYHYENPYVPIQGETSVPPVATRRSSHYYSQTSQGTAGAADKPTYSPQDVRSSLETKKAQDTTPQKSKGTKTTRAKNEEIKAKDDASDAQQPPGKPRAEKAQEPKSADKKMSKPKTLEKGQNEITPQNTKPKDARTADSKPSGTAKSKPAKAKATEPRHVPPQSHESKDKDADQKDSKPVKSEPAQAEIIGAKSKDTKPPQPGGIAEKAPDPTPLEAKPLSPKVSPIVSPQSPKSPKPLKSPQSPKSPIPDSKPLELPSMESKSIQTDSTPHGLEKSTSKEQNFEGRKPLEDKPPETKSPDPKAAPKLTWAGIVAGTSKGGKASAVKTGVTNKHSTQTGSHGFVSNTPSPPRDKKQHTSAPALTLDVEKLKQYEIDKPSIESMTTNDMRYETCDSNSEKESQNFQSAADTPMPTARNEATNDGNILRREGNAAKEDGELHSHGETSVESLQSSQAWAAEERKKASEPTQVLKESSPNSEEIMKDFHQSRRTSLAQAASPLVESLADEGKSTDDMDEQPTETTGVKTVEDESPRSDDTQPSGSMVENQEPIDRKVEAGDRPSGSYKSSRSPPNGRERGGNESSLPGLTAWMKEYKALCKNINAAYEPEKSKWTKEAETLKREIENLEERHAQTFSKWTGAGSKSTRTKQKQRFNSVSKIHKEKVEEMVLMTGRIEREMLSKPSEKSYPSFNQATARETFGHGPSSTYATSRLENAKLEAVKAPKPREYIPMTSLDSVVQQKPQQRLHSSEEVVNALEVGTSTILIMDRDGYRDRSRQLGEEPFDLLVWRNSSNRIRESDPDQSSPNAALKRESSPDSMHSSSSRIQELGDDEEEDTETPSPPSGPPSPWAQGATSQASPQESPTALPQASPTRAMSPPSPSKVKLPPSSPERTASPEPIAEANPTLTTSPQKKQGVKSYAQVAAGRSTVPLHTAPMQAKSTSAAHHDHNSPSPTRRVDTYSHKDASSTPTSSHTSPALPRRSQSTTPSVVSLPFSLQQQQRGRLGNSTPGQTASPNFQNMSPASQTRATSNTPRKTTRCGTTGSVGTDGKGKGKKSEAGHNDDDDWSVGPEGPWGDKGIKSLPPKGGDFEEKSDHNRPFMPWTKKRYMIWNLFCFYILVIHLCFLVPLRVTYKMYTGAKDIVTEKGE